MTVSNNSIIPGDLLDGKYTIGNVIGSGGMGTVYEAVHGDSNRRVAIKVLHSKYSKSPKIIERFHQEARFAGSIEHKNICRVIDHGTSKEGAPYLVMPLLTGRPLGKILETSKRLPSSQLVDIACQTLQALAAAHNRKIVHRDLKPDNIFVTRTEDHKDFVKLLDFGISKVLEQDTPSELTATGMVLGTAYYLAPEQARGSKKIDQRVDVYAMGVILYEALTGIRPFEGDTYNEVVFKIAGEPVKPPRVLNPEISPALERVILKAMAIDPLVRFTTAQEMCRALNTAMIADDQDVEDLEVTLADTDVEGARAVSVPDKRHRRVISLVVVVITATVIVLYFSLIQKDAPHREKTGLKKVTPALRKPEAARTSDVHSANHVPVVNEKTAGHRNADASEGVGPARDQESTEPLAETTAQMKKTEPIQPAKPPQDSPDAAVQSKSAPKLPVAPEDKQKPVRRGSKKRKKESEDMIKGRFNSTFVL